MENISNIEAGSVGEKVVEQIGALQEAKEHLATLGPMADEVDPKELGEWIGTFLKALASVLKI